MIEVLWEARDLYDYAVPDKGMEDVVESLRKEHRVIGCSSPLLGHVRSKLEFMWDHFGKGNTILTASKDLVVGDVLVDDGPHNIESFPGPVVVYDRPWNQELDRTHDLARATTPGGLLYHITEVLEYTSRAY
jgi:5'(3')-deoxyribonucleotidase